MRLALAVLAVIVATPAFAQSTGNNGGGNECIPVHEHSP